jgi:hypothetical protein
VQKKKKKKPKIKGQKLKDFEVKNYFFQSIDQSISESILEKNTIKELSQPKSLSF